MALETLKGVEKIGEFNEVDMDSIRISKPELFRPDGSMHYQRPLFHWDSENKRMRLDREAFKEINFKEIKKKLDLMETETMVVETLAEQSDLDKIESILKNISEKLGAHEIEQKINISQALEITKRIKSNCKDKYCEHSGVKIND